MSHAEAYKDPGSPEEQSRRTFMAQAVTAMGAVIGLGLAFPLLTSLIPSSDATEGSWSPLTPAEFGQLKAATSKPVKVSFDLHQTDGYLPPADTLEFVWAIRVSDAVMQKERPDLFTVGPAKVPYPVVTMGFTIFSPICPHLGCRYSWIAAQNKFICPCHGSEYTNVGQHIAGPAPRGLDPLPLREVNGTVEVTWIEYKQDTPDRIVLSIG